ECKEIFGNGFDITGICLDKHIEHEKTSIKIEETEGETRITYNKNHPIKGAIDINKILDVQLSEINDLLLKI
ncbi:MAG: hypothetical protein ABIJ47_13825, partial [Candidatus Bathyarchaeota archaeon]